MLIHSQKTIIFAPKTSPMKHTLAALFLIPCLLCTTLYAQTITSKAGERTYDRDELFKICQKSVSRVALPEWNIDQNKMCNCLTDSILLRLSPRDLEYVTAFRDNPKRFLTILLLTHYTEFEHCCGTVDRDKPNPIDFLTEETVQHCIEVYCYDADSKFKCDIEADMFCRCTANKMLSGNYTYEEIFNSFKKDGTVYNEAIMDCWTEIHPTSSSYSPCDIIGDSAFTTVQLSISYGIPRKVKISIGDIARYFLLDTGADDFVINREIEAMLLENGSIKESDYIGTMDITVADGSTVKGRLVRLNNVRIGDYTVNNVEAVILDEGSLLCGHGLLNKFRSWKLQDGVLYLYK